MNTEAAARVLVNEVHTLLRPPSLVGHVGDAGGKPPKEKLGLWGLGHTHSIRVPSRGSSAEIPRTGEPSCVRLGGDKGLGRRAAGQSPARQSHQPATLLAVTYGQVTTRPITPAPPALQKASASRETERRGSSPPPRQQGTGGFAQLMGRRKEKSHSLLALPGSCVGLAALGSTPKISGGSMGFPRYSL